MDDLIQLDVHLADEAEDPEYSDQVLRDLLYEVRQHDVEHADLQTRPGPAGTKGHEMMGVALQFAPPALSIVAAILGARLKSLRATVKFEGPLGGKRVKFEGTPKEFRAMLTQLARPADPAP